MICLSNLRRVTAPSYSNVMLEHMLRAAAQLAMTPVTPILRAHFSKVPARVTLRLLLATLSVFCIALGWWSQRAHEQRRIVQLIERSEDGRFYYDYQFKRGAFTIPNEKSKLPKWLIDVLGLDYFHRVTCVSVNDRKLVPQIAKLPGVEEIRIDDPSLRDQDLIPLTRMCDLQELQINWPWHPKWPVSQSMISDDAMRIIRRIPRIQDLNIAGHRVTREGLSELTKSPTLEYVSLWGCILRDEKLPFEVVRGTRVFVVEYEDANGTSAPYGARMDLKR